MYSGLFSPGYPSIALNITIMNRKIFISELALLSIGIASAHAQSAKEAVKPNVLFILADDLGWMDLGCYGSSFYECLCGMSRKLSYARQFSDRKVSGTASFDGLYPWWIFRTFT